MTLWLQPIETRDVDFLGEDVHRHVDQHRAGLAALGHKERLLDDLREEVRAFHAPGALDERLVDLELRAVGVEVHFLMRMLAVVVARHVAGDDDHRDAVERRVGDAGGRVGETGPQMGQQHRGLAGHTRIPVRGVRGDLLVPDIDEVQLAVGHRREHGDVGVAAEPEDVRDPARFEIPDELVRDEIAHLKSPRSVWSPIERSDQVVITLPSSSSSAGS